jgi:hypothetical protein
MMDRYGYGHMGWGDWIGMSFAVTLWTALVVFLAVWATRAIAPSTPTDVSARLTELEADVAHLRQQAHLTHRDGSGSRS